MNFSIKIIDRIEKIHFLYIATFLFFIAFVAYGNTLFNQLFFDDEQFIYKNNYVKNFSVIKYFTESVTTGGGIVSNYYRPLLLLTYGIEYKIFSGLPFIYHFDNIIFHATASIFLFLLLKRVLNNNFISILVSSLFVLHPIQTEAVAYASGRNDPLSAVFIFLSLIFFLKETNKTKIISALFFLIALLFRESAIITPLLAILLLLFKNKKIDNLRSYFSQIMPLIIVGGSYFLLRLTLLNFQNTLNFYSSPNLYSSNILIRFFTFLSILPTYFGLIFFPKTLFIDRTAEIIISPLNPLIISVIIFLAILLIISINIFKKEPIFLFSFLWFFIAILPTSGIIPINGIIYEHFLYLPSIGVFIIFSYFIYSLIKGKSLLVSNSVFILVVIFLLLLTGRTIARNKDWHDPITFYTQTIQNNPKSARLHNNLAMAFSDTGKINDAIKEYDQAILIDDSYPQTHFNLGNAYLSLNKIEEAEEEYLKALNIDRRFINAYLNLAKIYKFKKETYKIEALKNQLLLVEKSNPNIKYIIDYLNSSSQ